MERLKNHIRKYKTVYYCAATGVVVAVITGIIMRRNFSDNVQAMGALIDDNAQAMGASNISFSDVNANDSFNNSFNRIVNVVEREGRGHPGYMVKCVEEDLIWPSQISSADAHGVHPKIVSDHLNGITEHVAGHHLERVQMAA